MWLATTESIYWQGIAAHACIQYCTWEIVICEEYEVGGIHKGAVEDLSIIGMLHRVDWHIVRECYTVSTGT